jgi:hypothetical protein
MPTIILPPLAPIELRRNQPPPGVGQHAWHLLLRRLAAAQKRWETGRYLESQRRMRQAFELERAGMLSTEEWLAVESATAAWVSEASRRQDPTAALREALAALQDLQDDMASGLGPALRL